MRGKDGHRSGETSESGTLAAHGPERSSRLGNCRKELETKQEDMAPLEKFKWFYNTLERFLAQRPVKLVDITREPEIGELGVLPDSRFKPPLSASN